MGNNSVKAIVLAALLVAQGAAAQRLSTGAITGEIRSVDGSPAVGVRVSVLAVKGVRPLATTEPSKCATSR